MKKRLFTNILSQQFGKFASKEFHPAIQKFINRSYAKILNLDLGEFKAAETYRSLNALFTRELLKKRNYSADLDSFISPVDAMVTEYGELNGEKLLQIKGMEYSVRELLGEHVGENVERVIDGSYVNFYLSPRDYHRYHAPYYFRVSKAIHIPGKLYPVNLFYLRKQPNLFVENERVILECFDKEGALFYIVLVGALNVGKIVLSFDGRIHTNVNANEISEYTYDSLWLSKGELFGYFMMGSTAVMIFEKGYLDLLVKAGEKVRFGDVVGVLKSQKNRN